MIIVQRGMHSPETSPRRIAADGRAGGSRGSATARLAAQTSPSTHR